MQAHDAEPVLKIIGLGLRGVSSVNRLLGENLVVQCMEHLHRLLTCDVF